MNAPVSAIPKEDLWAECWERGELSYKYRPVQARMMKAWDESKDRSRQFVLHVSRQTGKSFFLNSLAIQLCLKSPRHKIIYVAPVKDKLKDFVTPIINTIIDDAPEDLRPQIVGNNLVFKNGSIVNYYGAVNESYKHIRGSAANEVILDEAGFMDSYTEIKSMIQPVLLRSKGFLIMSSSSPVSGDHPFCDDIQLAQKEGWYFLSTIYDDETITEDQIEAEARKYKGRHTTGFRREYLCEILTETERALVPEWNDKYIQDLTPTPFWPYYQTYLGMDI